MAEDWGGDSCCISAIIWDKGGSRREGEREEREEGRSGENSNWEVGKKHLLF